MGERIFISRVRLSFPHLFTPRAMEAGKDPVFQASFIVPLDHPAIAQIRAARQRVLTEAFPQGGMTRDLPMRQAGSKPTDDPSFAGCYILNSSAKSKPHTVDLNVVPLLDPSALYAGCYVNASVSIFSYKQKTGSGITFGLDGVQFVADGPRLDGRPAANQMFEAVAGAPAPIGPSAFPAMAAEALGTSWGAPGAEWKP